MSFPDSFEYQQRVRFGADLPRLMVIFNYSTQMQALVSRLINFVQYFGKLNFSIVDTFMQPWPEILCC